MDIAMIDACTQRAEEVFYAALDVKDGIEIVSLAEQRRLAGPVRRPPRAEEQDHRPIVAADAFRLEPSVDPGAPRLDLAADQDAVRQQGAAQRRPGGVDRRQRRVGRQPARDVGQIVRVDSDEGPAPVLAPISRARPGEPHRPRSIGHRPSATAPHGYQQRIRRRR